MSEKGSAIFKQYINYHNESIKKYGWEKYFCL